MQRVIRPIAVYSGIRSRAKQFRFMEQAYTAIYFAIFGPFGLYVMSKTPVWYFNMEGMYEGFPHKSHSALFKSYYLLQASYWAQQAIVLLLQLEKPRKDFKELVGHHIVTLALIWLSYRFHFTYMGLAVYITHDISDFFLAVSSISFAAAATRSQHFRTVQHRPQADPFIQSSKILNYLGSSLTVPYFTTFIGVWTYMRHYTNIRILYSVLTSFKTVGPFELNWETQQYKCWLSQYITFGLLAALQSLNLFWLYLILSIAVSVVFRKNEIQDVRSDDEDDEAEQQARKADLARQEELKLLNANGSPEKKGLNGHASEGKKEK